ncbi:MAG: hypothetical protein VX072_01770 [Pseudomonadota bacterium]|nr:hypothetical protein [Pseudomonadota bacterium]
MTRLLHLQGRLARRARWTVPLSHIATLAAFVTLAFSAVANLAAVILRAV